MKSEKWKYWKPSELVTSEYIITKLLHEESGLSVVLEKNDETSDILKLNFHGTAELYRVTDERSMQNRLCDVTNMNGNDFFTNHGFFIVENSNLIKWLEEESAGLMECFELKHFVFLNYNYFFDIVAHSNPEIEVIKLEGKIK